MKKLIFIAYMFLFSFGTQAQNDTVRPAGQALDFFLASDKGLKKTNPNGYIAFVKYSKSTEQNSDGYPLAENYEKIELELLNFVNQDEVQVIMNSYEYRTSREGLVITSEQRTYFEEGTAIVNLMLPEYQGMYYSSPRRMKLRSTFFTLSFASAFTALIVAPLASFQYSKGAGAFNQYDRNTYFGLLGLSAGLAAVSVPMCFVLKPKYYSFNGELLSRSNKRWKLIVAR
jgi:hypothetical protein